MFTQLCVTLALLLLASGHPVGVVMHTLLYCTSLCGSQDLPTSVALPKEVMTLYINGCWAPASPISISYNSFSLEPGFGTRGILEGSHPEVPGNETYRQA